MDLRKLFENLSDSSLNDIHFDFENNSLNCRFQFSGIHTLVRFNKLINFEYRPDASDFSPWIILEAHYKLIDLSSLLLNQHTLGIGDFDLSFPVVVSEFKSASVEIKIVCESIISEIIEVEKS